MPTLHWMQIYLLNIPDLIPNLYIFIGVISITMVKLVPGPARAIERTTNLNMLVIFLQFVDIWISCCNIEILKNIWGECVIFIELGMKESTFLPTLKGNNSCTAKDFRIKIESIQMVFIINEYS